MPMIDLPISELEQDSVERSRPHLDADRVSYYLEHLDESTPVWCSGLTAACFWPMVSIESRLPYSPIQRQTFD